MSKYFTNCIKLTLLSFFLLLLTRPANSQTISVEGFENTTFLPSGWSAVSTSTTLWSRRTTGTFPTCMPQGGIGMVRFSSRQQVAGTNQTIATPAIDYSVRGTNNAYISFWIFRDNGSVNGDSISLYINSSNSLTGAAHFGSVARYTKMSVPDTVAANGWAKYTFNVPSTYTGGTYYILIKGISQNGFNMYLDEFEWNSFPNLCNGKPSAGSITATPAVICNNGGNANLILSGQTTGVAGINYQWKSAPNINGPFNFVGTNSSTLNTGNINTTQYYKCVVTCNYSGLADSTSVVPVLVKSNPNPIVTITPSNASFCSGSQGAKLVASGASTYIWTPATGLSGNNTDTVYAAPSASTTYTVRGTDTAGCIAQATSNVTLRQSPVVAINSVDTNMCYNDSVLLTAQTGGGGNTYAWLPEGRPNASIFAKPLTTTTYTVTVTNGFGCKGYASKTINVLQKPKARFEVNIVNRTYYFYDSSVNAQSVYYDFGDGNSSTSRNPTYTYSFTGSKTIMMIAFNPPCGNDTFYRSFNVSGIQSSMVKNFTIYPNPAKDELNICLNQYSDLPVEICDLSGKVLMLANFNNTKTANINISALSSGLYFVKLGTQTTMFSKQ
ncbi:MAG: T9SS type A sorting domain-containing protein [Chitinophagaceae bacterium]